MARTSREAAHNMAVHSVAALGMAQLSTPDTPDKEESLCATNQMEDSNLQRAAVLKHHDGL